MSRTVIQVEGLAKGYRLGQVNEENCGQNNGQNSGQADGQDNGVALRLSPRSQNAAAFQRLESKIRDVV